MNELVYPQHQLRSFHLFAGAGGGILGDQLLGHRCDGAVEIDRHCREVLLARQRDGCIPRFPIWDDVRTFDGRPWRGRIDVVAGGFPCTDVAKCGSGKGLAGEKSGLWTEMARVVGEIMPSYVFVENSPLLYKRGLDVVLRDLAALGYDARWCVLGADSVGCPHHRARMWVLATHADLQRRAERQVHPEKQQPVYWRDAFRKSEQLRLSRAWLQMDQYCRLGTDDVVAGWVERVRAVGNGQVPAVAALAWTVLMDDQAWRPEAATVPKDGLMAVFDDVVVAA